jgi:VanZ family protein
MIRTARFWKWTYVGWFITLCILSSMSHPGPHIDVVGFDKVEHFTYFLLGGLALGFALTLGRTESCQVGWILLIVGSAVGWFDEWHQSFTPGRSGLDVYDWIADTAGSGAAGLLLARARARLLRWA